jgi:hypothetical protein
MLITVVKKPYIYIRAMPIKDKKPPVSFILGLWPYLFIKYSFQLGVSKIVIYLTT